MHLVDLEGTTSKTFNAGHLVRNKPAESLFIVEFTSTTTASRTVQLRPCLVNITGVQVMGIHSTAPLAGASATLFVRSRQVSQRLSSLRMNGFQSDAIAAYGFDSGAGAPSTVGTEQQPKHYFQPTDLHEVDFQLTDGAGTLLAIGGGVTVTLVIKLFNVTQV